MRGILALVERELASGKRTINIWDGNHGSAAPAQVAYSRELFDVVRRYGKPAYVLEEVGATKADVEVFHERVERFKALPSRDAQQASLVELKRGKPERDKMTLDLFGYAAEGAAIITPDPRREDLKVAHEAWYNSLSQQEKDVYAQGDDAKNNETTKPVYERLEQKNVELYLEKILNFADPALNARIAANIKTALPPNAATVNLYGYGHFGGLNDLNEQLGPSLNIAVTDLPAKMRKEYYSSMQQMPDYVFYADRNRLVKMDTPEARREFLGMDALEYAKYRADLAIREKETPIAVPPQQTTHTPAAPCFQTPCDPIVEPRR